MNRRIKNYFETRCRRYLLDNAQAKNDEDQIAINKAISIASFSPSDDMNKIIIVYNGKQFEMNWDDVFINNDYKNLIY